MGDFIEDFMDLTAGHFSPEIYRLWSAIALVGGACERRVWVRTGQYDTYLNQYILLVGTPGTGKYIVETVRDLWSDVKKPGTTTAAFKIAPDSLTKASLMDCLGAAENKILLTEGQSYAYHTLQIAAEELSVMLPAYDMEYVGILNSLYMNKDYYEERRRASNVKQLRIEYPQLNIIAGTQPSYLATLLPENAWASGLSRRLFMVYSGEVKTYDVFAVAEVAIGLRQQILDHLGILSTAYGQITWDNEAAAIMSEWNLSGAQPVPTHSKLAHYNRSRTMFMMKLAGISVMARRSATFIITKFDLARAMGWLFQAERLMPDIFREMIGKSDSQIIEELWFYLQTTWLKNGRQPISEDDVYYFLKDRVPSEKIRTIVEVALRSGVMTLKDTSQPPQYIPRPKYQHGVE